MSSDPDWTKQISEPSLVLCVVISSEIIHMLSFFFFERESDEQIGNC